MDNSSTNQNVVNFQFALSAAGSVPYAKFSVTVSVFSISLQIQCTQAEITSHFIFSVRQHTAYTLRVLSSVCPFFRHIGESYKNG